MRGSIFNGLYSCKIKFGGDVTMKREPKEELMRKTDMIKGYQASHCPDIFKEMNLEIVKKNCPYFTKFVAELDKAVATIKK